METNYRCTGISMAERILVVDDEESIRFTFQYLLADHGYEVAVAGSQNEALAIFSAGRFDLVFLDLLLGAHSGIDTLQRIREIDSDCPVVMITGAPDETTVSRAILLGAFAYIPKPIRRDTLLDVTEKALEFHRSHL